MGIKTATASISGIEETPTAELQRSPLQKHM